MLQQVLLLRADHGGLHVPALHHRVVLHRLLRLPLAAADPLVQAADPLSRLVRAPREMLPLSRLPDLFNRALPVLPVLPPRVPHQHISAGAAPVVHSDSRGHGWRAAVCPNGADH